MSNLSVLCYSGLFADCPWLRRIISCIHKATKNILNQSFDSIFRSPLKFTVLFWSETRAGSPRGVSRPFPAETEKFPGKRAETGRDPVAKLSQQGSAGTLGMRNGI